MIINHAMDTFLGNLTSGQINLLLVELNLNAVEWSKLESAERVSRLMVVYTYAVDFGEGVVSVEFELYEDGELEVTVA